ncbi:MAG: phosphoglycolate phosphatase [Gammaproteobacteria bacterium]|nr:phosphoglycolate phosphatase [Gammaproteobacteria bacterium]
MNTISTVLFDLDGTLIDTAPDLAHALNETRGNRGLPPIEFNKIRQAVSLGGAAMIKLAFNVEKTAPEFPVIRDEFLSIYSDNIHIHSKYFDGMEAVINTLENSGYQWGIVTNKPGWLTTPLLQSIGLNTRVKCVVSGDTLPYMKPSPEPLLHACKQLDCPADVCVYVGDAKRDIEAGSAAGMQTIIATYGYIEETAILDEWGADSMIDHPKELLEWLKPDHL